MYYRPTPIQLAIAHPVVIDWVPFPSIRDRLVVFHSSNPRLDEIICEIADAYACDIDLSKVIQGFPLTTGFLRVRDLLRTISEGNGGSSNGEFTSSSDHSLGEDGLFSSDDSSHVTSHQHQVPLLECEVDNLTHSTSNLPARSISALFKSKDLALQVFHMLGMDKGPGNLRLDPAFFEKHPELYDGGTDLLARGVPIRAPNSDPTIVAGPKPLDLSILNKYREMVMWTFETMCVGNENESGGGLRNY
jgi:hypothetical protein